MPATVVLDTNVWVSAFLNPHGFPAKLLDAWISGAFQVVISAPLVEELAQTLSTPRLMLKYCTPIAMSASILIALSAEPVQ